MIKSIKQMKNMRNFGTANKEFKKQLAEQMQKAYDDGYTDGMQNNPKKDIIGAVENDNN